jgi:putative membrane protein insertion efficiency factor
VKTLLIALVNGYRYAISPMLGRHCRFVPSCSEYAVEALQAHGALAGAGLACARLCCCHPWHAGGYDPVPPAKSQNVTRDDDAQHAPERSSRFAFLHRTP